MPLSKRLANKCSLLEMMTMNSSYKRAYQVLICLPIVGSEWDFVIISLVRSLPDSKIEPAPSRYWLRENLGFVTDEHQINVALTRAKRGLCIVGM